MKTSYTSLAVKCFRTIGVAILTLLFIMSDNALCQLTPDTAFVITDTDKQWLTYYDVVNKFDSATVSFQYGEMLVKNSVQKRRILPITTLTSYTWVQSTATGNIQSDIQALMKWDTLTIPPSSELRFYRKASVKSCCPEQNDHQHPNGASSSWSVSDSVTECILEARDVTCDTVVFVADSVGITACNSATYAGFYGNNSVVTYHTLSIPQSAWGKRVYLTIKPKRIGTTPYGMECVTTPYPFARSLVDRGSALGFASKSKHDSLMAKRFSLFMQYAHAAWDAYCWIPKHNQFSFSKEETDTLLSHFYRDTIVDGRTVWKMKECNGDSCGIVYAKSSNTQHRKEHNTTLYTNALSVENVKTDGSRISLDLDLKGAPQRIMLSAFLISGQEVGWPYWVTINEGRSTVTLEVGHVPTPVVVVRVANEHGYALAFTKVFLR